MALLFRAESNSCLWVIASAVQPPGSPPTLFRMFRFLFRPQNKNRNCIGENFRDLFFFPGLVVKLCFPVILFRYQNPTLDLLGPNWSDLPAYKREKGNEDDPRCFLSLLLSPSVSLSISLILSFCLSLSPTVSNSLFLTCLSFQLVFGHSASFLSSI